MKSKLLQDVLERAEAWPEEAQRALAEFAHDIEEGLGRDYEPTADELAGIDRGLQAADAGRFATEAEVVFAKFGRG